MQETQFGTRLAHEDKRWLLGDADLGSVLAPFTAGLAAPVSLEAAPQPQPQLTSALMTVSTGINALTQEQVRLREALETLNSTLSTREQTLATKTADLTAAPGASEQKKPEPATRSWSDQGLEIGADAVKFVGKEVVAVCGIRPKTGFQAKRLMQWRPGTQPPPSGLKRTRTVTKGKSAAAREHFLLTFVGHWNRRSLRCLRVLARPPGSKKKRGLKTNRKDRVASVARPVNPARARSRPAWSEGGRISSRNMLRLRPRSRPHLMSWSRRSVHSMARVQAGRRPVCLAVRLPLLLYLRQRTP